LARALIIIMKFICRGHQGVFLSRRSWSCHHYFGQFMSPYPFYRSCRLLLNIHYTKWENEWEIISDHVSPLKLFGEFL
jgi:hypothetical protein